WRAKALKRAREKAEKSGQSLEDLVGERCDKKVDGFPRRKLSWPGGGERIGLSRGRNELASLAASEGRIAADDTGGLIGKVGKDSGSSGGRGGRLRIGRDARDTDVLKRFSSKLEDALGRNDETRRDRDGDGGDRDGDNEDSNDRDRERQTATKRRTARGTLAITVAGQTDRNGSGGARSDRGENHHRRQDDDVDGGRGGKASRHGVAETGGRAQSRGDSRDRQIGGERQLVAGTDRSGRSDDAAGRGGSGDGREGRGVVGDGRERKQKATGGSDGGETLLAGRSRDGDVDTPADAAAASAASSAEKSAEASLHPEVVGGSHSAVKIAEKEEAQAKAAPPAKPLTEAELTKLAVAAMKAKLKGDKATHARLTEEVRKPRLWRSFHLACFSLATYGLRFEPGQDDSSAGGTVGGNSDSQWPGGRGGRDEGRGEDAEELEVVTAFDENGRPVKTGGAALMREDMRTGARKGKLKKVGGRWAEQKDESVADFVRREREQGFENMDETFLRNVTRLGNKFKGTELGGAHTGLAGEDEEEEVRHECWLLPEDRMTAVAAAERQKTKAIAQHRRQAAATSR
ncbi:unnamed protein product, partial [Scytosiphon promiscuus]